jgi:hypothetical protein
MWQAAMWQAIGQDIRDDVNWRQRQDELNARQDTEVRRRVADARAAGINPLYALGAATTSDVVQLGTRNVPNIAAAITASNRQKQEAEESQARTELLKSRKNLIDQQVEDSKNARDIQKTNSQQDGDYVERVPDQVPMSSSNSQHSGPGGTIIKGKLGNYAFNKNQPSAQQYEDRTGEVVSMIESTMQTAEAWGKYKSFKKEAANRYKLKPRPRTKSDRIYNAKQKWRRAKWIEYRAKIFLKKGR